MPPHPLTNFEIKDYYENEPRFNGVYSRDNLTKMIKNRAYVKNLDEYADVDTDWIDLYVNVYCLYPLSDQMKFRVNEINKIKDYFNSEIQERKRMSKKTE